MGQQEKIQILRKLIANAFYSPHLVQLQKASIEPFLAVIEKSVKRFFCSKKEIN